MWIFYRLTHWKQDLFLLDTPVEVVQGGTVVGSIVLSRNPEYRRHIRAEFKFMVTSGNEIVST
jgi:protein arginine N-methyltransferase 2